MSSLKELLKESDIQLQAETLLKALSPETIYKVDLGRHLDSWARKKQHLYELFGNKLKIEQEVVSYVSPEVISRRIDKFIIRDLGDNKVYFLVKLFLENKVSAKEIGQNYLDNNITFFGSRFNKGMKISRILPRLCNSKYSEKVQIAYSRVVESFSYTGKAVLSIDPLDYLTMSENGSNWRSCHALDGEYRTAVLAYMMDSASVIAYVTTNEIETPASKIRYADKLWRQVVWFSNPVVSEIEFAIQSRQYPGKNKSNNSTIESMIAKLFEDKYGCSNKALKVGRDDLDDMMKEPNHYREMWYNDIRRGSITKSNVIMPEYFTDKFEQNQYIFYRKVEIGVADIYCACGCGMDLNDPNWLFCSSVEDDDDEYDNEEEE